MKKDINDADDNYQQAAGELQKANVELRELRIEIVRLRKMRSVGGDGDNLGEFAFSQGTRTPSRGNNKILKTPKMTKIDIQKAQNHFISNNNNINSIYNNRNNPLHRHLLVPSPPHPPLGLHGWSVRPERTLTCSALV